MRLPTLKYPEDTEEDMSQFVKTWKEINQKDHKFYRCFKNLSQYHTHSQVNHFCITKDFTPTQIITGICHGSASPAHSYTDNKADLLYWVNNYYRTYKDYQPFFRWITNPKDSPWRISLHKSQVILDNNNHISSIMHKADCPAYPMINMGIGARLMTEHHGYPTWIKHVQDGIHPALAYIFTYFFFSNGDLFNRAGHTCFHTLFDTSVKRFITGDPKITKETEGSYQENRGNSRGNIIWNDGTRAENEKIWTVAGFIKEMRQNKYSKNLYPHWRFVDPNWNLIQDNLFKQLELEPYDPKSSSYLF